MQVDRSFGTRQWVEERIILSPARVHEGAGMSDMFDAEGALVGAVFLAVTAVGGTNNPGVTVKIYSNDGEGNEVQVGSFSKQSAVLADRILKPIMVPFPNLQAKWTIVGNDPEINFEVEFRGLQ